MKITALIENTTHRDDIITQHGLSLYIQTKEHTILFDMGQTEDFITNAKTLGCDVSKVDFGVLSHGHYDHGGGLAAFLDANHTAPVYVNKNAFAPFYGHGGEYIGLDPVLQHNPRLIHTNGDININPSCCLLTLPAHIAQPSTGLFCKIDGVHLSDDFAHEQYLLIQEEGQRVLISGCSHKGILPIVDYFQPDVLVGGFHFFRIEESQEIAQKGEALNRYPTHYYTCHCTGEAQYHQLTKTVNRLHYLAGGETVEI